MFQIAILKSFHNVPLNKIITMLNIHLFAYFFNILYNILN
nr:MAG TPA: hypothetical protein [Caudoviricetes sp.]